MGRPRGTRKGVRTVSNTVFQRRQAERFAQLLDADEAPGRHSWSPLDEELVDHLVMAGRLATLSIPQARPDPDFRASLRAMLVATAERDGIGSTATGDDPGPAVVPPARAGRRARRQGRRPILGGKRARAAVIVGVATGTLALSGISVASGDAVPGDPLYGVKRSTENARLVFAGSGASRGQTYLSFAHNRAVEAGAVRTDPARLEQTVADMDSETTQGVSLLTAAALDQHDPGPLDAIDNFVEAQRPMVADLLPDLSGADLARVRQSLALLDRIDQRSTRLRASLSCPSGDGSDNPTDDLGPLPRSCSSPPSGGTHRQPPTSDSSRSDPNSSPSSDPSPTPSIGASSGSPTPASPSPSDPASPSAPASASPQPSGLLDALFGLLGL